MTLKATLLPWKGQIVCDGLIAPYSVILGSGIVRNAEDAYRQAKADRGIITSLEETGSTEAEPAVQRRKRRRTKVRANLLLDADIMEHFKQQAEVSGKRPDTLINAALRQMIAETVSDEDFSRAFDELFIGPRRRKRRRCS